MSEPRVVGVRHHSPACARLVERLILQERPSIVLIEGPSDFNDRISQLQLDHQLPLALCSSRQGERRAYTPFCDYSPEWVALRRGAEVGAQVLFMDLPAWHPAFWDTPNRYHDRFLLDEERLARQLGYDSSDGLWDAWVEQAEEHDFETRLALYFTELRRLVSDQDLQREAFMAQCLAWAQARGQTLAVCGGFHAPILQQAWRDHPAEWPQTELDGQTCLVPFSFSRLDSFSGYASGMPSPEYYQGLWEEGWQGAARRCFQAVVARLRAQHQSVSSADLIAAWSSAEMLQRIRGHRHLSRIDLLDGLVSALVKEALESPLPWSGRGRLESSTHPVLRVLVEVFSGTRRGRLHPATPRPSLALEVMELLHQHNLWPTHPPRTLQVTPGSPESHLLHRLQLLEVAGFSRLQKDPELWSLSETLEFEPSLWEASALGNSLEEAAVQALERLLAAQNGAAEVGALLAQASQAGLLELCRRCLQRLEPALRAESQVAPLATALTDLDISARLAPDLLDVARGLIHSGLERALWLLEGLGGDQPEVVEALAGLRDLWRRYPDASVRAVMQRLAASAPVGLRGASSGLLWSLYAEGPSLKVAVRGVYPPENLGDFLHGLFALARQSVLEQEELLEELHQLLTGLEGETFLRALPALRLAFQRFPPAEKQEIALRLLPRLGLSHPRQLLRSSLSTARAQQAAELDHWVEQEAQRLGW